MIFVQKENTINMQETRSCEMEKIAELQREIEVVRKELDVVAAADVSAEECYQASLRLDRLIEDYMRYTKEEYHLQDCWHLV